MRNSLHSALFFGVTASLLINPAFLRAESTGSEEVLCAAVVACADGKPDESVFPRLLENGKPNVCYENLREICAGSDDDTPVGDIPAGCEAVAEDMASAAMELAKENKGLRKKLRRARRGLKANR